MHNGSRAALAVAALLLLSFLTSCATAGTSGSAGSAGDIPRLANGKPDLNGIWQALNEANYDVEMHVARAALQMREGPWGPLPDVPVMRLGAVVSVPPGMGVVKGGGKIPYKPEALEQKRENQANWLERDPEVKCYLPGIPRANYMPQPFQIFHSEDALFFAYQYAGAVREVYLQDPGPAPVDSWMGQSYGYWDGDTMVIEVTGQLDSTWFDRSGNHHSDQLKVTERWTPMGPNHLWYEATIEDPVTFTEPWTIAMPLYRRMEPDAQLMEFRCVEFVEELLYGEWRRNPLPR
ncbi:MAG: hypothetical protein R3E86_05245 [Pseudomonadales bacterium]